MVYSQYLLEPKTYYNTQYWANLNAKIVHLCLSICLSKAPMYTLYIHRVSHVETPKNIETQNFEPQKWAKPTNIYENIEV